MKTLLSVTLLVLTTAAVAVGQSTIGTDSGQMKDQMGLYTPPDRSATGLSG